MFGTEGTRKEYIQPSNFAAEGRRWNPSDTHAQAAEDRRSIKEN